MTDNEPLPKGLDSTPRQETRTPRLITTLIRRGGGLLGRKNQRTEPSGTSPITEISVRPSAADMTIMRMESYYDRLDRIRYAPESVAEAQDATRFLYDTSMSNWSDMEQAGHPELPRTYASLLLSEGILPTPDTASGFVLYSPSAHKGLYEETFARYLDAEIDKSFDEPDPLPQIVAADMFGRTDPGGEEFRPGFDPEKFTGEGLSHVTFEKRSAEAKDINRPVDVIWDRLGALWHAQQIRTRNIDREEIVRLLKVYQKVLKPNGCVVVDAAEDSTRGVYASTFDFLEGRVPGSEDKVDPWKVDLESLGWRMSTIGSGEARLAILKPIPES